MSVNLLRVLAFPITWPIDGVLWLAQRIQDQVESVYYDEGSVRAGLLELELKLDLGEITEEEYQAAEDILVARLAEIREWRAAQGS